MIRKIGVLAVFGMALSACASLRTAPVTPPPLSSDAPRNPPPPASAHSWARCAPGTACAPKEKSPHRQYYDAHHRRYYYYDPMTRRYYWEDGMPKT